MADPTTDQPFRRTLHTHPSVPIYAASSLAPYSKGYTSASWLRQAPIFTAALEIIETSTPITASIKPAPSQLSSAISRHPPVDLGRNSPAAKASRASTFPTPPQPRHNLMSNTELDEILTVSIHLLDPTSRELFAAAPYTHPSVITPCTDSGRYFALRVADDTGRKATLGIGFERREDAFEFVAALGSARKILGFERLGMDVAGRGGKVDAPMRALLKPATPGRGGDVRMNDVKGTSTGTRTNGVEGASHGGASDAALFAIEPPPPSPAVEYDEESRREAFDSDVPGVEDDEFGDFQ